MSQLRELFGKHPQLTTWAVLALGMLVILFLLMPADLGLLPGQLGTIVIATIVLAGLCVWIIGWD